jgi:hypothetical protein
VSRSQPLLPYRVLPPDAVVALGQGWTVQASGTEVVVPSGEALLEWDAKLAFTMQRTYRLEVDIAEVLGIEPRSLRCEIVVTGATGDGARREVMLRRPIDQGAGGEITVSIAPSSEALAKALRLTTGIYLGADAKPCDRLAPRRKGSRLWESSDLIRLEGGAARLPIYEVEFSRVFAGDQIENAEFHVELFEDSDVDLESALAVYINSERPGFAAEIAVPGSHAERRLWSGVIRRVITSQLLSGELDDVGELPPNSLAATVLRWIQMIWPNVPVETIREKATRSYPQFEAQIDSCVSLLEDKTPGGRAA